MRSSVHLEHHFGSIEAQQHAVRLGMWMFLATEVLLFAGLFVGYGAYRVLYPATWKVGSEHLSTVLGTVNTLVLVTSSLSVALALSFAKRGRTGLASVLLMVTLALALGFLVIKGFEYRDHFREGAYPGPNYSVEGFQLPGASLFFTIYFLMTGLHAVHVIAGMSVLGWMTVRTAVGEFGPEHHQPLEMAALYWHLVDIVWIFLYPLLYLV